MKILRKILKWFIYFLFVPISYLIISLLLTFITINRTELIVENKKEIYLSTNGIHLEIIIPVTADLYLLLIFWDLFIQKFQGIGNNFGFAPFFISLNNPAPSFHHISITRVSTSIGTSFHMV